jgi:hypothetical protein
VRSRYRRGNEQRTEEAGNERHERNADSRVNNMIAIIIYANVNYLKETSTMPEPARCKCVNTATSRDVIAQH